MAAGGLGGARAATLTLPAPGRGAGVMLASGAMLAWGPLDSTHALPHLLQLARMELEESPSSPKPALHPPGVQLQRVPPPKQITSRFWPLNPLCRRKIYFSFFAD